MRRVAAILAIVVGVTLIGFTFAEHLFSRSQDAQKVADQYAPLMSDTRTARPEHGLQPREGRRW